MLETIQGRTLPRPTSPAAAPARRYRPIFSGLATIIVVAAALWLGFAAWHRYDATPWTRDARVRAFAVTVAPEISGRIVAIAVHDNEFVRKGQVLFRIEPADFANRLAVARATLAADRAIAGMKAADAARRARLPSIAVSAETRDNAAAAAQAAAARVQADEARVAQAALDLARTVVRAPVSGTITNLTAHEGDYAHAGSGVITMVDTRELWVTAYFEETELDQIRPGEPARIELMSDPGRVLDGHVQGIGRGIADANMQDARSGLPRVDPVYSWVRLSQRIPVHVTLDHVPPSMFLAAGMTATVRIVAPAARRR
ncbi:efflux RND transporter periplasmic adaptor subunit [Acidiphilium multivorum]|uniref:efflux RND transporter periplasmic adaptor subunit n=1 Tax=Acidiphilium multivorum TaxID=62140 RepID=UPI002015F203|nr:HlyD family secretion protein [Acidiphilium multivorum]